MRKQKKFKTDFTKNVEESKIQAEKAKLKIPQIQEQIYYADTKTKENRAALHGAKEAASRSLLDADEAKTIAEKASQVRTMNYLLLTLLRFAFATLLCPFII
jgi:predicted  nucleic acid-binding Zn-ribbon protein